jgi:hypothetical protein
MAVKGLGLYPKYDTGWAIHLRNIFERSNVAAFGIAELTLVAQAKQFSKHVDGQTVTKNFDRLRYQLHARKPITRSVDPANLIAPGDTAKVIWISHGGYARDDDENKYSTKFAPHHDTTGPDARMSAKEVARCIRQVCVDTNGTPVYPSHLMFISCYAGCPRLQTWPSGFPISQSAEPLGARVLRHLHAMFAPAPTTTCTVYAPLRDFMGMEAHGLSIPPNLAQNDWFSLTL